MKILKKIEKLAKIAKRIYYIAKMAIYVNYNLIMLFKGGKELYFQKELKDIETKLLETVSTKGK